MGWGVGLFQTILGVFKSKCRRLTDVGISESGHPLDIQDRVREILKYPSALNPDLAFGGIITAEGSYFHYLSGLSQQYEPSSDDATQLFFESPLTSIEDLQREWKSLDRKLLATYARLRLFATDLTSAGDLIAEVPIEVGQNVKVRVFLPQRLLDRIQSSIADSELDPNDLRWTNRYNQSNFLRLELENKLQGAGKRDGRQELIQLQDPRRAGTWPHGDRSPFSYSKSSFAAHPLSKMIFHCPRASRRQMELYVAI